MRLVDGDEALAGGVQIIATPGHTPGHQSLVVEAEGVTTVIGGQCCYTCAEFEAGVGLISDLHDESWDEAARQSLERLASFDPDVVHLSHDRAILRTQP